jgi:hypothetical protein
LRFGQKLRTAWSMAPNISVEASDGMKLVGRFGSSWSDRPVHQGISLQCVVIYSTDKSNFLRLSFEQSPIAVLRRCLPLQADVVF